MYFCWCFFEVTNVFCIIDNIIFCTVIRVLFCLKMHNCRFFQPYYSFNRMTTNIIHILTIFHSRGPIFAHMINFSNIYNSFQQYKIKKKTFKKSCHSPANLNTQIFFLRVISVYKTTQISILIEETVFKRKYLYYNTEVGLSTFTFEG